MSKVDRTELKKNIIVFILACIICFFILEISIRVLGDYDVDGEFQFLGQRIKPYTLPNKSLSLQIADFENTKKTYRVPDPYLGWTNANNAQYSNKIYFTNSMGIRSDREYGGKKPDGIIRIALFGDSFIHSDEIPLEQSLAFHLEKIISKEFSIEVMNFGVSGYGFDQAYLRWKLFGKNYSPDIIIIGFQPENCRRNLNIIRIIYVKNEGTPFSKPRFYLNNNSLKLINYPTVPFYKMQEIVNNIENFELREFEYFYNPENYKTNLIYQSKALAVISKFIENIKKENNEKIFYQVDSNESKLCYEIISKFYNEASNDSRVYLLHIPVRGSIERKIKGKDYVYEQLLKKMEDNFNLINPDKELIKEAENTSIQSLFSIYRDCRKSS